MASKLDEKEKPVTLSGVDRDLLYRVILSLTEGRGIGYFDHDDRKRILELLDTVKPEWRK